MFVQASLCRQTNTQAPLPQCQRHTGYTPHMPDSNCARADPWRRLLSLLLAMASLAAAGAASRGHGGSSDSCSSLSLVVCFVSSSSSCPLWLDHVCRFARLCCAAAPQAEQSRAQVSSTAPTKASGAALSCHQLPHPMVLIQCSCGLVSAVWTALSARARSPLCLLSPRLVSPPAAPSKQDRLAPSSSLRAESR